MQYGILNIPLSAKKKYINFILHDLELTGYHMSDLVEDPRTLWKTILNALIYDVSFSIPNIVSTGSRILEGPRLSAKICTTHVKGYHL